MLCKMVGINSWNRSAATLLHVASLLSVLCLAQIGCTSSADSTAGKREFISVGTAPVGGAFYTVGSAICEVVNDNRGDLNWRVNAESTGGSMENIRLLSQGKLQFAMSNSSITYFAVRGSEGWEEAHEVQSVMTLFPNVAMFVTLANSGIEKVSDLKGKSVYVGPEGAGFEYFVKPILAAHGLTLDDIDGRFGSQQSAVDLLGDGAVVAAMVGGGIPNPALSQMAQANSIRLIPYDTEAKQKLIADYSFFEAAVIPAGTYNGIDAQYDGLNVGSAHLITHKSVDEQTVYDFAKLVYEHRAEIAERHRAALNIRPETVAVQSGVDYHPGAERFYREIGV
ncbi:MAG: TAXI family TRAP transporter solute-binding subunit, partial [Planctomycetales bacterium]|nr:TAXI family TRAP transporter solute-binding subunit [Planctomycetales bacterium]